MKPSEVKAVAAVLDEEHGSAVDAAKAAIKALDDTRRDVRQLAIVRWEGFPVVVGGYSTPKQVQKALQEGYGGSKWSVGYLVTPGCIEGRREATEDPTGAHHCAECGHPEVAHINQRWKTQAGTWRKPGCMCCDCQEKP